MFTNELNMNLPLRTWVENPSHEIKIHWLSDNEKVLGATVSKEGHADSILEYEKPITIGFQEKSATVNSASYYEIFG